MSSVYSEQQLSDEGNPYPRVSTLRSALRRSPIRYFDQKWREYAWLPDQQAMLLLPKNCDGEHVMHGDATLVGPPRVGEHVVVYRETPEGAMEQQCVLYVTAVWYNRYASKRVRTVRIHYTLSDDTYF